MTVTERPPARRSDPAVRPRCSACGSRDVVRDAWAGWDEDQACWVLDTVFDHMLCQACDRSTDIVWTHDEAVPCDAGSMR